MFEEYQNKEFKYCYTMTQRLNLNQDMSVSLCHGIEVGDYIIHRKSANKRINSQWYEKEIGKILEKSYIRKNAFCERCSNYKNQRFVFDGIHVVTINTSNSCNCRCVYCSNWAALNRRRSYNPLPFIQSLVELNLLNQNCLFDWGGGEPTLNPYFEQTAEYLKNNGYRQRVNTNALLHSDYLQKLLDEGNCDVRISLDAGDKQSFYNEKGIDAYDDVCRSIIEYARGNEDKVVLKYVLNKTNSLKESIEGFLNFCKHNGIKRVVLDADLNSYSYIKYQGPLVFDEEELEAARLFMDYARQIGLHPSIGYVFTAFTDILARDYNEISISGKENYSLPETPPKHELNNRIYTAKIYPYVYASLEALVSELDNETIVFVDGIMGKMMFHELKRKTVQISRVFSSVEKLVDYLQANKNEKCVLCTVRINEVMSDINRHITLDKTDNIYCITMDPYRFFRRRKAFDCYHILSELEKRLYTKKIWEEKENL